MPWAAGATGAAAREATAMVVGPDASRAPRGGWGSQSPRCATPPPRKRASRPRRRRSLTSRRSIRGPCNVSRRTWKPVWRICGCPRRTPSSCELPVLTCGAVSPSTTGLIARGSEEQCRRTKVIPRFCAEGSCLKLAYAALQRAAERWQRVRITELDHRTGGGATGAPTATTTACCLVLPPPSDAIRRLRRPRGPSLLQQIWDLTLAQSSKPPSGTAC